MEREAGGVGVDDDGINVLEALCTERLFELLEQGSAYALTARARGSENDGPFDIPFVGVVRTERFAAAIAENASIGVLGDVEWIHEFRVANLRKVFLDGRIVDGKGYDKVVDVTAVDVVAGTCVGIFGNANAEMIVHVGKGGDKLGLRAKRNGGERVTRR